jgi:hypothetical protein
MVFAKRGEQGARRAVESRQNGIKQAPNRDYNVQCSKPSCSNETKAFHFPGSWSGSAVDVCLFWVIAGVAPRPGTRGHGLKIGLRALGMPERIPGMETLGIRAA